MKNAQFATEHLLVVAFSVLVIIPVVILFYQYSSEQNDDIINEQIIKIGNTVVDNSEMMYFMGPPAKVTLQERFPSGLSSIEILGEKEFVIRKGESEYAFVSDVPIFGVYYGDRNSDPQQICSDSRNKRACSSQGLKNILIEADVDKVYITIK